MNPTVKAAWLAALRDVKTKKHKGKWQMKKNGNLSALGVLCDLSTKETFSGKKPKWKKGEWEHTGETEPEILPQSVLDWAGLENSDPRLTVPEGTFSLGELNDGVHGAPLKTLSEIADLIETQL